ncbi:MAG: LysM peptidoglycan-binding domain-containing protein, partial [Chitinophagales bacterium]|nr:LysM peptidoglycan-binding domain-containing protein [Chitinophagales bacterium]
RILDIADVYQTSLSRIKELNPDIRDINNVHVGKVINIEKTTYVKVEPKADYQNFIIYVAKPGDTLKTASSTYNVPIDILKSINGFNENQPLQPGQKIKIPTL